jgi:hypothetical protein
LTQGEEAELPREEASPPSTCGVLRSEGELSLKESESIFGTFDYSLPSKGSSRYTTW